jgi:RNA polymerase sigma-70 factor (ECF subfamily)
MRAAIGGNETAYRTLLKDLSRVLRKAVRRGLCGLGTSGNEVEDVVQDILLALHLKRHTWDASMPLTPWVMAVARNKIIDNLRRQRGRPEFALDLSDFEGEDQQASIDAQDLARVLRRLPDRNRDVVRSMSIEGHSARDVAARLGMTEVGVRVVLHRSLKALADTYQE